MLPQLHHERSRGQLLRIRVVEALQGVEEGPPPSINDPALPFGDVAAHDSGPPVDDAPAIKPEVPEEGEGVLRLVRQGESEIDDAEFFSRPVVDEDDEWVPVRDLVGVATHRNRFVLPPSNLHVRLGGSDGEVDEVPLANEDADRNEGGGDCDAALLLPSLLLSVTFFFWWVPVKNKCGVPFVKQIHGDDLPLKFAGGRDVIHFVERLLVSKGTDEDQCPGVDVGGAALLAAQHFQLR